MPASRDPDDSTLNRVLQHLEDRLDPVGVVRLVQRWDEVSGAPRAARLVEARALLQLRLMDRAWVRLRELTESDPKDAVALALMAEMFIERGWPARARKTLDRIRALDSDEEVPEGLVTRAASPPLQPPPNAREVERTGSPSEVLALAERYLATGSVIRGRALLERLRRGGVEEARVEQLLWALRGEFNSPRLSLADLVADLCPPASVAEWEQAARTESIRLDDLNQADPPTAELHKLPLDARPGGGAFPTLFRRDPSTDGRLRPGEEEEVTVTSHMASEQELADAPPEEATDAGPAIPEARDDTRIMQVIPRGGGQRLGKVDGPIHTRKDTPDRLRETLDLRAYQKSMGMTDIARDGESGDSDESFLEEEDEDLVVMTRREEPLETPEPPKKVRRGPIEVIEKVPVPVVAPELSPPPTPLEEQDESGEEPDFDERRDRRWTLLFTAAAVLAVVAAMAGLFLLQAFKSVMSDLEVDRVRPALAAGDYRGLLDLEAELGQRVERGDATGTVMAEFALVETVLWSEYTGDAKRRKRARELIDQAGSDGARRSSLALASGTFALASGDLNGARFWQEQVDPNQESARYLTAQLALAEGDVEGAVEAWEPGKGTGVRHRLLGPVILQARGDVEGAAAMGQILEDEAPQHPLVWLAALERDWDGLDEDSRLARVQGLEQDKSGRVLAPRHQARLHILQAQALEEQDQASAALDAYRLARNVDGGNPEILYALGSAALEDNRVIDSLQDFEECLEARPADVRCLRGTTQALIDLDRLVEAEELLRAWTWDSSVRALLRSWVALEGGEPELARSRMADAEAARRLANLDALVRARVRLGSTPSATDDELVEVARRLARSSDRLDQRLALRLEASRLLEEGTEVSPDSLARLSARGRTDPVVQVFLGRFYERQGRGSTAAQYFDRATEIGPENGFALHQSGLFYDAPPYTRSRHAWERYLSLAPSGARADHVRQKLALR